MLIQKQTTGEVYVIQNSEVLAVMDETCTMRVSELKSGVRVTDATGRHFEFYTFLVRELQVLPAAAVAFSGDVADLWAALQADFFVDLEQSGGGVVPPENITTVGAGTYNILSTDAILVATADCTMVLPTIGGTNYTFRVFANGFVVSLKAAVGDTIVSEPDVIISGVSMVSVRNLIGSNWLIGD